MSSLSLGGHVFPKQLSLVCRRERGGGGSDTNFGQSILHLAVIAVLAVLIACSIVPGRPPCVPGRINPDNGRPDCDTGLL